MREIVERLNKNEVVCFKTDTVYGLSCNPFSETAVEKIFNLKQRNQNSPLILLISKSYNYSDIVEINPLSKKLIDKFWPGPLTIIFKAKQKFVKGIVRDGKVSLRMPNDEFCQNLLSQVKFPLTSTSANISGQATLDSFGDLKKQFPSVYIVDGGNVLQNQTSSIVDVSEGNLKIIREGKISKKALVSAIVERN